MAKDLLRLCILLFHFACSSYCVSQTYWKKSLHLAPHLRDDILLNRRSEFTVQQHVTEENVGFISEETLRQLREEHTRNKRAATKSENGTKPRPGPDKMQPDSSMYSFNDSHTQMVIHWAGDNSDVIIALTKGPSLASNPNITHQVFVSYDYGRNFTKITNKMHLSNNSTAKIDQFYNSPASNSHYFFTDIDHQYLFTTHDYGRSVFTVSLIFKPKDISFHSTNINQALAVDADDYSPHKVLYMTTDFGATWREVQTNVKTFYWERSNYQDKDCIYVQRVSTWNKFSILRSCDGFRTDIVTLLEGAHDFEISGDYMFATKNLTLLGGKGYTHQIWVSYKRAAFYNAKFPHDLTHLDYYVADASEDQVFLCVNHNVSVTHLYISDVSGTDFSISLEDVLYFNPNGSHGNSWLRYYRDEPFADVYKVNGMRGVYIATQLINQTLRSDYQRSLITFDKGGEWEMLVAPERDLQNRPTNCSWRDRETLTLKRHWGQHCSLHLTQEFHHLDSNTHAYPILSKKSAPGLVIGTGNWGSKINMTGTSGIFLSSDAGNSWHQILQGMHYFALADHGGVIVAIESYEPTNQLIYSTDEGLNWHSYNFSSSPMRVYGLLTEPGEKTTVLFLFGSYTQHHSWKIVSLDMRTVFMYNCTKDDYKLWSLPDNLPGRGCLLGRKVIFERRSPHSNCYNGRDYDRQIITSNCTCKREDFRCDIGYSPNRLFGSSICNKDEDSGAVDSMPHPCPIGTFYPVTRGYVKIAGDTCHGGDEHRYQPLQYSCHVREIQEFMLYSNKNEIRRHLFDNSSDTALVTEDTDRFISAVDFGYAQNCLYWAESGLNRIQRLCLTGNSSVHTLHNTSLASVEALAYDWMGDNIYWIDSHFKVIEVSRSNGSHRRELFKGAPLLDKPRGLALDPVHSWMYWTDWSYTNPRIMKSWMDGRNDSVTTVINGTSNVGWPNGIAIDFALERLYWTDSQHHQIASCDFNGGNLKIIYTSTFYLPRPYSIAVYKENLYWTDTINMAIYRADKTDGSSRVGVKSGLEYVLDLKILHRESQQVGNKACTTGTQCSQLCLLKPGSNGSNNRTCRCDNNSTLSVLEVGGDEHCCIYNNTGHCENASTTKCVSGYFMCHSTGHRCIPIRWQCDGDNDCGDYSDERDCPYKECLESQFTCDSGRCIPASWRCDSDNDCGDFSDERNCTYPNCSADEFQCTKGRCITRSWQCDYDNDCPDASDERNCTYNETCEIGEFRCSSGQPRCVLQSQVCDHMNHCSDRSDERNCSYMSNSTCPSWKRTCNDGNCIYSSWWCDGDNDCPDHSDEANCATSAETTTGQPTTALPRICRSSQFQCDNKACISFTYICDGINDCGDNSDEFNCPGTTTRPVFCQANQFRCYNSSLPPCIDLSRVCNNVNDCYYGEDEMGCSVPTTVAPCSTNEFTCYSSSQPRCVFQSDVCDGHVDCYAAEDERNCTGVNQCRAGEFQCRQSRGCISRRKICDNTNDCADGSDEFGCGNETLPPQVNRTCKTEEFSCTVGQGCVPYILTCNGQGNCPDSSDEYLPQCTVRTNLTVGSLRTVNVMNSSITLEWVPVNVTNVSYIVSYVTHIHGDNIGKNSTTNKTTYTIQSLHAATTYWLTVYVKKSGIVYRPPTPILVHTLDKAPEAPINVTARYSDETIQVLWSAPVVQNGLIQKYKVYIEKVSAPSKEHYIDNLHVTRAVIGQFDLENFQLQSGTNYSVWVTAFTGAGEGKASRKVSVVFAENLVPQIVPNLRVAEAKQHSIKLSWDKPAGAEVKQYIIRYMDLWDTEINKTTTDQSYNLSGLCAGSTYSFSVFASNMNGMGEPAILNQQTRGPKLVEPSNVSVNAQSETEVKVSWTIPKGASKNESFTVFYDYNPNHMHPYSIEQEAMKKITTSDNVVIDNLSACKSYMFRVAVTGSGRCRLGAASVAETGEDVSAPPPCDDFVFYPTNKTAGTLKWTASCQRENFQPVGYTVRLTDTQSGNSRYTTYLSTKEQALQLAIRNLSAGATYNVTIKTTDKYNSQKTMRWSCVKAITLDAYDAPEDLQIKPNLTTRGGTGILVWRSATKQLPAGTFRGYEVLSCNHSLGESGCSDGSVNFTVYNHTNTESLQYGPLTPGRFYTFKVRLARIEGYYGKLSESEELVFEGAPIPSAQPPSVLTKSNMIYIIIGVSSVVVVLVIIVIVLVVRHRRLQRSFLAFASSHYDTRSGTTSFMAADELGEDEDSPMIRGFSDDEPLVIA